MTTKQIIFYVVIFINIALLIGLFFKWIPIQLDKYSITILFGFIGLSLLPFADKLKIGNLLEFEKLKEKVNAVEHYSLLGEVVALKDNDSSYYNDTTGLHKIPDEQTRDFLKTSKGILIIKKKEFKKLNKSYDLDSVKSGNYIRDNQGTVFVILNDKKYYVNSWSYIYDWGHSEQDVKILDMDNLRKIPSAK